MSLPWRCGIEREDYKPWLLRLDLRLVFVVGVGRFSTFPLIVVGPGNWGTARLSTVRCSTVGSTLARQRMMLFRISPTKARRDFDFSFLIEATKSLAPEPMPSKLSIRINQLRHTRMTEIRKQYGLEASKACAGHREIGVTQHYAEQNRLLASKVMEEIG